MRHASSSAVSPASALAAFEDVRNASVGLVRGLSDADATVQSMEDASPAKWHLAHTTWFFETFVLAPHAPGYRVFDDRYGFLFNSYYEAVGARHPRPRRGLLTRPPLDEVLAYRAHVDAAMAAYLPGAGLLPFDPTNNLIGGTDLVRVGVASHASQAVPVSGEWFGYPADFGGMQVDVQVSRRA